MPDDNDKSPDLIGRLRAEKGLTTVGLFRDLASNSDKLLSDLAEVQTERMLKGIGIPLPKKEL